MDSYYSIGEAADISDTTVEALRHYDRINLLKPARIDPVSKYRYYTDLEISHIHLINFCKQRNMKLN